MSAIEDPCRQIGNPFSIGTLAVKIRKQLITFHVRPPLLIYPCASFASHDPHALRPHNPTGKKKEKNFLFRDREFQLLSRNHVSTSVSHGSSSSATLTHECLLASASSCSYCMINYSLEFKISLFFVCSYIAILLGRTFHHCSPASPSYLNRNNLRSTSAKRGQTDGCG